MPRRTGRGSELWDFLLSDGNLGMAIDEVNESHHFSGKHKPNSCTAWVQETKEERIRELRQIIINGFVQKKPKVNRWRLRAGALKDQSGGCRTLWDTATGGGTPYHGSTTFSA